MNEFGNMLNALRKEKNWTQTELADKLGVTNQAVSKWETGDTYPETAQLLKLSELFDITVDELLKGRMPEKRETAPARVPAKRPASWNKKFALTVSGAMLFFLAGVIATVVYGILDENNVISGVMILLACATIGVGMLVFAGIMHEFYFLEINREEHKEKVKRFAAAISAGVCLCIAGAMCFTACGYFEENKTAIALLMTGGFILIAIAVALFIYFGMSWKAYSDDLASGGIILPDNHEQPPKGASRFCGVVMLACTAVFLVLGFVLNAWHPSWVVFPVGGIICGILGAIDESKKQ